MTEQYEDILGDWENLQSCINDVRGFLYLASETFNAHFHWVSDGEKRIWAEAVDLAIVEGLKRIERAREICAAMDESDRAAMADEVIDAAPADGGVQ